ncbi:hypothetical protein CGMCC3_g8462 [Colletotrichum fructicola]|nr:uncharacterized protein CGMCC3_g8462 [Colletotrichum fructicola]KAE9575472.1 hypothetical protein CGMCC3_g8462 [Colletotrichum fructicola]
MTFSIATPQKSFVIATDDGGVAAQWANDLSTLHTPDRRTLQLTWPNFHDEF